jgi:hypothetical protein
MITAPGFESETSFNGSDSVGSFDDMLGTFVNTGEDCGVVSHNGSDMDQQQVSDGSDGCGSGVMILAAIDNGSSRNETFDLSIPGTDSLPTDVGSLSESNEDLGLHDHYGHPRHSRLLRKRSIFLLSVSALCMGPAGLIFLLRERNSYRSSVHKLEQEIQRLQDEKQEIKTSCESPPWMEKEEKESEYFTIFDNCWIKAKANVQVGECSEKASELPQSVFSMFMGVMSELLEGTCHPDSPPSDQESDSEKEETKGFEQASKIISSFPLVVGEAIVTASKTFSKTREPIDGTGENATPDHEAATDSLSEASEALSGAINAVGEVMASEMKELSDDPLHYLAAAMKGASHTAKQQERVTMKGILNAASAVSSASLAWGEALAENGGVLSVKMTEMLHDPLSYFEYESKTKQD